MKARWAQGSFPRRSTAISLFQRVNPNPVEIESSFQFNG